MKTHLSFRLDIGQYRALENEANDAGVTVSEYLRSLLPTENKVKTFERIENGKQILYADKI